MDDSQYVIEECSRLNLDDGELREIQRALIDHIPGEYPDSDGDFACEFIVADGPPSPQRRAGKRTDDDGGGGGGGGGGEQGGGRRIGQKRRQDSRNDGVGDPGRSGSVSRRCTGSSSSWSNGIVGDRDGGNNHDGRDDDDDDDDDGGDHDDDDDEEDDDDDDDDVYNHATGRRATGRPSNEGQTLGRRGQSVPEASTVGGGDEVAGSSSGSFMEVSDDGDDQELFDQASFVCQLCKSAEVPLRLVYPMARCSCLFCKPCVAEYVQSYIDDRRRDWQATIQEWETAVCGGDHHLHQHHLKPDANRNHDSHPSYNCNGAGGSAQDDRREPGENPNAQAPAAAAAAAAAAASADDNRKRRPGITMPEEDSIRCPNAPSCSGFLSLEDCQEVAPAAARRWCDSATQVLLARSDFVRCPNPTCHVVIERIEGTPPDGVLPCGVPEIDRTMPFLSSELGEDGRPMTREAILHRARNRYRCSLCNIVFCGKCLAIPYHLGESCEDHWAAKCRFCGEKLVTRGSTRGSTGGVSADDVDQWTAAMSVKALKREVERRRLDMAWCVEKQDLVEVLQLSDCVCTQSDCRAKLESACSRKLECGHRCAGIRGESGCLPCLEESCQSRHRDERDGNALLPSADDLCSICMAEPLRSAPVIKMGCGHVVHRQCAVAKVKAGYPGPAISFGFLDCPLCSAEMTHASLDELMAKQRELKRAVRRKALRQLEMNLASHEIKELQSGGRFEGRREEYAMRTYQFYICCKCHKPYFGGERACGDAAEGEERVGGGGEGREGGGGDGEQRPWHQRGPRHWFGWEQRGGEEQEREHQRAAGNGGGQREQGRNRGYNAADLICGGCSSGASNSEHCKAVHGNEYVQYKCRYCCSVASFFCWGKTHFCESCHEKRPDIHGSLPPRCRGSKYCPLGVSHPPHGTEFCLGCALCRFKGS